MDPVNELTVDVPKIEMNISVDAKNDLVRSEQVLGMCQEIMSDIQAEREEVTEAYTNFSEMVFNAGDATAASKEALVNLLKLRVDLIDRKSKVMETLLKMCNAGPKQVTAHQHNDIQLIDKRKKIRELNTPKEKR